MFARRQRLGLNTRIIRNALLRAIWRKGNRITWMS